MKIIGRLIMITLGVSTFLMLLWLISNQQQKTKLNAWYQLIASPIIERGYNLPHSLIPADEESHQAQLTEYERPKVCGKVKSEALDHSYNVYQWTDINGQIKISDVAPSIGYTNLRVHELFVENFFDLDVDSDLAALPAFTQDHIQAGVSKIYKTFSDIIGIAELRKIKLKIKFISDENAFHTYRRQVAPSSNNNVTGFYNSGINQSVIWAVGDKQHLTRISLHESTHAMVAAMFGDIPVWLNEGMAEFFDMMVITGEQTYKFATNDQHLKLLRSSRLPSLESHFSQSNTEWNHPNNSKLNYAIDWSLIFYLMTHSEGQELLRYMLNDFAVNYCHPIKASDFIAKHYPGGVRKLESNWKDWLKVAPSGTITF